MAKMMLAVHRVPGSCKMGCCGFLNLKKNADRKIARKIQRKREKNFWLDRRREAW